MKENCKIMIQKFKTFWFQTNRWHRAIALLALIEFGVIPQRHLGFYCNDASLSHTYTGDTISWKLLLILAIFLPLVVLWITETTLHKRLKLDSVEPAKRVSTRHWYKEYSYGLLLNIVIVQFLKLLIGSPRPHFFDTCKPIEAASCEESEYVSYFTCTSSSGKTATWLAQSSQSFPSGHTSISVHTSLFIAWYLYKRSQTVGQDKSNFVRTLQSMLIVSALVCSLSRIVDRRHHWWDVLAGCGLGMVTLLYTVIVLCDNFNDEALNTTLKESSSTEKPLENLEKSVLKDVPINEENS